MVITAKNIIGKPVITKGGAVLGKVSDFEVDVNTRVVVNFFVQGSILLGVLTIASSQIIDITNDKVIVEDMAMPDGGIEIKVAY
ncbi:MAG: hypothetical protein COU81_01405 [Candidatus Portnoybacteria bacterium CG10_big_fil_rev_8_21_14_0_10_36_7]|uniref:PRC-barrel domain-containing protein n=1 Tax=Candidatus Portnoybacteria bacterium CG10_big_fil_rev_8_21_14_0_10_36_7 TaxID=1974812 RepID=A0A2M8KEG2_9BACT|nr:MAG: hypothetical protein COU81_01405 [Candidatus Portnoybacteria bacterium CG10_big_fil_rev_8_21_14_0_10_36_7]